ncbi:D-lactate dehydrogenase [Paraburkholderia phenoliruptrix]|uniref:Quinone-dependent D-lactate dehydrogenase n=1 Tax=Paraburkholderia phenoliruptrix TaxID=252970 RepID=A0ABV3WK22_9BURK
MPPTSQLADGSAIHSKFQIHGDRELVNALVTAVGRRRVLTGERATRRYRTGIRFGEGRVLAVVRPGSLVEQWRALEACVRACAIVIPQASNTGLTGGSTPDGSEYDRPVVIISTRRLRGIHLIDGGRQVVCLPGSTLNELEQRLRPLGREPHSVIGSSCIGASVFGGVCNNSGGALVHRGPAYTELSVYASVSESGQLRLHNHLGIELGDRPEDILQRLEAGNFPAENIRQDVGKASDADYSRHVRDVDASSPARYNADPRRLYESSGSAGKVMVFGLRLDTFPAEVGANVLYIGTSQPEVLAAVRRDLLRNLVELPIAGEYLHRDAFNVSETYGKDMFLLIKHFGTSRLPGFFAAKAWADGLFARSKLLPKHFPDRALQAISKWLPAHLPSRLVEYRNRYEHHLMLKVKAGSVEETRVLLERQLAGGRGSYFLCSESEARDAFLNRFVTAGAAIRYRAMHPDTVEDIVALDIALRRNERQWLEKLPQDLDAAFTMKIYYGHFLCHVMHQDYMVRKGGDCIALEHRLLELQDSRGAEYPAEHNVGHLYEAKPTLRAFYKQLDPCNCFNPGLGKTSKKWMYRDDETG